MRHGQFALDERDRRRSAPGLIDAIAVERRGALESLARAPTSSRSRVQLNLDDLRWCVTVRGHFDLPDALWIPPPRGPTTGRVTSRCSSAIGLELQLQGRFAWRARRAIPQPRFQVLLLRCSACLWRANEVEDPSNARRYGTALIRLRVWGALVGTVLALGTTTRRICSKRNRGEHRGLYKACEGASVLRVHSLSFQCVG